MKKLFAILLIIFFSFGFKAKADEGMWLLPLIEKLNMGKMTELGLKLSAEDIYSLNKVCLKDAVVIFGGGCTAEIVSPKALYLQITIADMDRSRHIAALTTTTSRTDSGLCQKKKSCRTPIFL